jgi:hypothetical protein
MHDYVNSNSGKFLEKLFPTQLEMLQVFRTYPNESIVLQMINTLFH